MFQGETVLSGAKGATTADFEVMRSAAGYYIGTRCKDGTPYTRETGYWQREEEAAAALKVFKRTNRLPGQR